MEIWKWIDGFEGAFQVSNYGHLKSFKKNKNGHLMSNINKKGGYLSVVLVYKNKTRYCRIHNLVAEAFISPKPFKHHTHHIDGNKQNNNVENLIYLSTKDHTKETMLNNPHFLDGMINYNKYVKTKTIYQYDKNMNFIKKYPNAKEASIETGVCQRNILQVANKEEYRPGLIRSQAGGFIWKLE